MFQPAIWVLPLMLSFDGCCFSRLMAKRRSHERLSAKCRSRARLWSSLNVTSSTQCSEFSIVPASSLFPRNQVRRPARAVVGFGAELEAGATGDADEFGVGGGGGFDKSVVPAEPVIHQPAHRFDNGPAAGAAVVGVGGAATALGGHFSGRQAAAPALVGHEAGPGGEIGAVRVSVAVAPHVEGVFAQGLGRPFGFAIVAGEGESSEFLNVTHVRRLRLSQVYSTGLDVSTSRN